MVGNQGGKSLRLFNPKSRKEDHTSQSGSVVRKKGLEALPDEILYQIFELISPEQKTPLKFQLETSFWVYEEPQELLCLIRCSRRLYQIGAPFLYNTFIQSHPISWVPFMRTILASPDLTYYVQNLKLSTRRYYQMLITNTDILSKENIQLMHYHLESRTIDDQIQTLSLENEYLKMSQRASGNAQPLPVIYNRKGLTAMESLARVRNGIVSAPKPESLTQRLKNRASNLLSSSVPPPIPSTGLPTSHDAEQIVRNLVADDWKAMATYLIYRLPQLTTLTLEEDKYHARSSDLEPIIQRALSPQSITMCRLKKFILIYTKRTNTSKLQTYWPLLLQPSLRSFSASKVQEYGWLPQPRDLQLPLTHLSFSQCNLSSSSIDAFLKCCPNLEYLYYSHVQSWDEQPFIPRLFGTSIQQLQHKLKHLTLHRAELQYDLPVTREAEFSTLESSLKPFSKLKTLDITAHLLLGPQRSERSKWWKASRSYNCAKQGLLAGIPCGLEKFKLRDCGDDFWEEIKALVGGGREGSEGSSGVAVEYTESRRETEVEEEVVRGQMSVEEVVGGLRVRGMGLLIDVNWLDKR